jgi:hypothetical protein
MSKPTPQSINDATPEDWDRLRKEHPAVIEDSIDYYKLPNNATKLQHLISYKNMNAQMGEIFRSCYRYGSASHSDQLRDAKKIKFCINAEIERLETWSK